VTTRRRHIDRRRSIHDVDDVGRVARVGDGILRVDANAIEGRIDHAAIGKREDIGVSGSVHAHVPARIGGVRAIPSEVECARRRTEP
jgi:hypothetical protein